MEKKTFQWTLIVSNSQVISRITIDQGLSQDLLPFHKLPRNSQVISRITLDQGLHQDLLPFRLFT